VPAATRILQGPSEADALGQNSYQCPLDRRILSLRTDYMTRTFKELAFLSDDVEGVRGSMRVKFKDEFAVIEGVANTAVAELRGISGTFNPNYLVGVAFWLRCVEACQGAVLLTERGLPTAPFAVLRTALECLFTACAVWRKPESIARLEQQHHFERIQQAQLMMKFQATLGVTHEQIALLKEIASTPRVEKAWTVFDAASAAGFEQLYQVAYRGLALGGAHASPRSLDDFWKDEDDGAVGLGLDPSDRQLTLVLNIVKTCLASGMERHREALAAGRI